VTYITPVRGSTVAVVSPAAAANKLVPPVAHAIDPAPLRVDPIIVVASLNSDGDSSGTGSDAGVSGVLTLSPLRLSAPTPSPGPPAT
jgi:hypothetical protein